MKIVFANSADRPPEDNKLINKQPKTIKAVEEIEIQIAPYGEYACRDGSETREGSAPQSVTPEAMRAGGQYLPRIEVERAQPRMSHVSHAPHPKRRDRARYAPRADRFLARRQEGSDPR